MRNYRELTPDEFDRLEALYPSTPNYRLSQMFDISIGSIGRVLAKKYGWKKDWKALHSKDFRYPPLTEDKIMYIRRNYAEMRNADMLKRLDIPFGQFQKVVNDYKLRKSDGFRERMHTFSLGAAHKACKDYGFYRTIGKANSKRLREMYARGEYIPGAIGSPDFVHPKQRMSEEEFRDIYRRAGDTRRELARKERLRIKWGLKQRTKLHLIPDGPTKAHRQRLSMRTRLRKLGYIVDTGECDVYYPAGIERHPKMEANAMKLGFSFIPVDEEKEII